MFSSRFLSLFLFCALCISGLQVCATQAYMNDYNANAYAKGAYKGNGNVRVAESIAEFMSKASSKLIKKHLSQGHSLRTTAKLSDCSPGKVMKVKRYLDNIC